MFNPCTAQVKTFDGSNPYATLLNVKGELYGTTYYGGKFRYGLCCGTVFEITP